MEENSFNYKKYRWFFTKSEKLVYGGKSAEQNEEILNEIAKDKKEDYVIMHTKDPGSPFAIIVAPIKKISEEDLVETAVWTACFSRAWRMGKKKAVVDVFTKSQLYKMKSMKAGTWGVKGKVERKDAQLKLVLTLQKGIVRAVPFESLNPEDKIISEVFPGKIPKEIFSKVIADKIKKPLEEVLMALPTGGFKAK
ncbi:Uncharacterised protein [uncultured archaeon]|nr:Uncharacterised protein [uncultured archaeon]